MKDATHALSVGSTKGLSKTPRRNFPRLLEPDALAPSLIQIGTQSYESLVFILMAILQGITENTCSGDVVALGVFRAKDLCRKYGINDNEFADVVTRYLAFSDEIRKGNPLAF